MITIDDYTWHSFRETTAASVKCVWISFSAKWNSCVWPVWESCLSLTLIFIVSSLLSLHARVQAAAGGDMSLFIAPLMLLWRFFSTPKSGNIVSCHFEFCFALSIHNEREWKETRLFWVFLTYWQAYPVFSLTTPPPPVLVYSWMTVRLCISVANLHKHSMMNYT